MQQNICWRLVDYCNINFRMFGMVGEIYLKVSVKKLIFKTVIFAIICMTVNGYAYKLFKNILNGAQTKVKGEMNIAQLNYSKIVF